MSRTIQWRPGLSLPHDPAAVEIYRFDWSAWLGDESLVSVTILPNGISATQFNIGAKACNVRVSGGTAGSTATVTVRATSSGGRIQSRTVNFAIQHR